MIKALLVLAAIASAYAQPPAFEVVSIKPSPPGGSTVSSGGGPGTRDPGTWRCVNMALGNIVFIAFNIRSEQLVALVALDWMNEPRFDITAKVPQGATREQLYQMLQNMLAERFGLKFHQDQREVQGYQLVVSKSGPKFRKSVPEPPKEASNSESPPPWIRWLPNDPDWISGVDRMGNRARGQWLRIAIQRLARDLADQIGAPVIDATGLTGIYDISIYWVPDPMRQGDEGGPSLFEALQAQLGLRLEPKRATIPIVVIDHAEKAPTEN